MSAKKTQYGSPVWSDLNPGDDTVKIVQLWKTDLGPQKPEVALLLMTADKYEDFRKDPLGWILNNKIFDAAAVDRVIHSACHRPNAPLLRGGKVASGTIWYISLHHDPSCTVTTMAQVAETS